jgi:hypothetical protein
MLMAQRCSCGGPRCNRTYFAVIQSCTSQLFERHFPNTISLNAQATTLLTQEDQHQHSAQNQHTLTCPDLCRNAMELLRQMKPSTYPYFTLVVCLLLIILLLSVGPEKSCRMHCSLPRLIVITQML